MPASPRRTRPDPGMERSYLSFDGAAPFVGWRHRDAAAPPLGAVAVICGPIGSEYTRAHRTLRHLADGFAAAGIPAIRFDYHGAGNSPGDDLDPGRFAAWRANIRTAIEAARGGDDSLAVILAGVRLGATLAVQVAAELQVDTLVLWNPVAKGRVYARELQAMAAVAERNQCDVPGAVESGGFVMSAETLAEVAQVDLGKVTPKARRIVWLARDDAAIDASIPEGWRAAGAEIALHAVSGWAGMMAEHQFTVVPEAALKTVVDTVKAGLAPTVARRILNDPMPPAATAGAGPVGVTFGGGLFGVLHPPEEPASGKPAVVMFNAGAVHHVGPNRIYVEMARRLAAEGYPCLRFDLEGLGDSVLRGEGRENHPYPATATRDARAAFRYLREAHGYDRFVALGLCSGAHTAFHAALEIEDEAIEQLVLINPLTFHWTEGMGLETTARIYDEVAYRQSARDPKRWLKLLRGDVNFRRLLAVAAAVPIKWARARWDWFCEALLPAWAPPLARELRRLRRMGRPVAFFIAEGDPGERLLLEGAPRTARLYQESGMVSVTRIPAADHTFSQLVPRRALIERLVSCLARGKRVADRRRAVRTIPSSASA